MNQLSHNGAVSQLVQIIILRFISLQAIEGPSIRSNLIHTPTGIADAKSEQFAGDEITHRSGEYMDGYIMGYCSVNHTAQNSIPGFDLNCSQPLYPGN